MELQNNVRVLVAQHGYKSFQEFTKANNISYYMVRKLANNETNSIDIELLLNLCKAFNCNIDDLFYIEN